MEFIERRAISLEERTEVYKALGHVTRLQIFEKILMKSARSHESNEGLCITDIASMFDFTLPTISKHLDILKQAGLIKTHKEGKKIFVSADIRRSKKICESLADLIASYEAKNTFSQLAK
jgi:ArsR family transcriptional regulator